MSESSEVQGPLMDYARSLGCWVEKVSIEGRKDFPDLLILKDCIWMLIECKLPGKKLRPTQEREQRRLRENGALAFDVDNVVDGMMLIDLLVEKRILAYTP